jgi:hypothetical protein
MSTRLPRVCALPFVLALLGGAPLCRFSSPSVLATGLLRLTLLAPGIVRMPLSGKHSSELIVPVSWNDTRLPLECFATIPSQWRAMRQLAPRAVPPRLNRGIPLDWSMSESKEPLIRSWEGAMPKAYSVDTRTRVIARVESGASRREAAGHYDVSPSTAVIWVKCFRETGRCAAKPRGGSISPMGEHAEFC